MDLRCPVGEVKVIPTIAWFDAGGIYNLLSGAKARQAEERFYRRAREGQWF